MLLEESKCILQQKKIDAYIIDDIEISPDSDWENSIEESPDEENSSK